jgi:hypothetical protein
MITSANSLETPLLAPDRGRPIPEWLLARLRATLGVDFSGVSIHLGPAANAACTALGAAAFALDDRVFFAQGSAEPFSPEGLRLLAHELAHITQQRLGAKRRASAPVIHLESEANAAAEAVLHGSPFRVALSDARGEPACWNIAGHYYIPYLMFLNAGVSRTDAQRIALWCWLPDQVSEFDATGVLNPFIGGSARAVQAGLHVLSGGDGELEAKKRANHFRDKSLSLFYRALALHPFGDCFSHRKFRGIVNADDTVLWGDIPFIGHAIDGHASDDLWNEGRWAVVCAYIRSLGRLANEYQGTQGKVPLDDIVAALSPILRGAPRVQNRAAQKVATASAAIGSVVAADEPETWPHVVPDWSKICATARKLAQANVRLDEGGCGTHINHVAQQLLQVGESPMNANWEPVEWSEYCKRYRSMIMMDAGTNNLDEVFDQIQLCAAKWSGTALASIHRRTRRTS